jgi:hypothetical protein
MPPQLAASNRRHDRHSEPRALVELTPHVDIHDLCHWKVFPDTWDKAHVLEMSFRYPWAKSLVISLQNIEFLHVSGYNQHVALHWVPTYFGKPRPIFVCPQCHCGARRLFLRFGSLKCRYCHGIQNASRQRDHNGRKRLAASKLRLKLGGWPNIEEPLPPKPKWQRKHTYRRITNKIQALERKAKTQHFQKPLDTKLFAYHVSER